MPPVSGNSGLVRRRTSSANGSALVAIGFGTCKGSRLAAQSLLTPRRVPGHTVGSVCLIEATLLGARNDAYDCCELCSLTVIWARCRTGTG